MSIRINSAFAQFLANAAVDGFDGGQLIIYDGARPASADVAIGAQVPLVTFNLPTPAFGDAAATTPGATATANDIPAVQASATSTATFFRMKSADGTRIIDGTVTDVNGTGDLKLSSTSVISGIDVTVVSLTVTFPKGA